MLAGLKEGQEKMSKTDADSAIFMEDSEEDVNRKINKAYCPPGNVTENPVFDYIKYIIFGYLEKFTIEWLEKWGGTKSYDSYEKLCTDYLEGKMAAADIKKALALEINRLI